MNSEVQRNKASTAKSNSQRHMNGMHNYSQSGRTYQSEQYTGPLDRRTKILPKEERKRKTDETVRPQNLRAVEKFLGRKTNNPTAEIVKTFHLTPHPSGLQYSSGKADEVFKILCERYPYAKNYKGWNDLYYSMRNCFPVRKEPMKTVKVKNDEHFEIDDCKPIYNNGDKVYIVHYCDNMFQAFEGKIISYYIKELSGGSFDIMYEIKASCFGINSGWKRQGNRTVFGSMDEARARAEEKNKRM